MNIKKYIPNTLTMLNAASGSIAVFILLSGYENMQQAVWFIILAAVFDFFDGFSARLLKVSSDEGKELDSLSDMISFGFAPAAIMFRLFLQALNIKTQDFLHLEHINYLPAVAILILTYSGLRLAKFNLDEEQHHEFKGLATPANALLVASLLFLDPSGIFSFIFKSWFLVGLTILLSLLLVSPLRMFSFKLQSFKFRENIWQYGFLIVSILLLVFLQMQAIFFIMCLYIILNILRYFDKRKA